MSLTSLSSLSDVEDYVPRSRFPDREDLFSKHDGEEFHKRYRISKHAVLKILKMLHLEPLTQRNKAVNGLTQLLICLRFFETGSFQQVLNDLTGIQNKATVGRIVVKVSQELAKLADVYIKMPDMEEAQTVAEDFYSIAGLPRVVGALDCTHVKVVSTSGLLSEKKYRNKEGFFSINVQVVCDSSFKIRNLVAGSLGSFDDCTIFNSSPLRTDLELGRYGNFHLLGDSGYYNKKYLLTPFLNPQTDAEVAYNNSQKATHKTIETCFSLWKRRCPCLQKGIHLNKVSTVLQVIIACAVLHNICIDLDEVEPPDDLEGGELTNIESSLLSAAESYDDLSARTYLVNTVFNSGENKVFT